METDVKMRFLCFIVFPGSSREAGVARENPPIGKDHLHPVGSVSIAIEQQVTVVLHVENMTCTSCVGKVERLLLKQPGE